MKKKVEIVLGSVVVFFVTSVFMTAVISKFTRVEGGGWDALFTFSMAIIVTLVGITGFMVVFRTVHEMWKNKHGQTRNRTPR